MRINMVGFRIVSEAKQGCDLFQGRHNSVLDEVLGRHQSRHYWVSTSLFLGVLNCAQFFWFLHLAAWARDFSVLLRFSLGFCLDLRSGLFFDNIVESVNVNHERWALELHNRLDCGWAGEALLL